MNVYVAYARWVRVTCRLVYRVCRMKADPRRLRVTTILAARHWHRSTVSGDGQVGTQVTFDVTRG